VNSPKHAGIASAVATFARITVRAAPLRVVTTMLLEPIAGALGALVGLWLKLLSDAAVLGSGREAAAAAALLAGTFALERTLTAVGLRIRLGAQERVAFALEKHLATALGDTATLDPLETPEYLDRLDLLRRGRDYYWYSLSALVQGGRELVRLAGMLILLATIDPWLTALLVLGVPILVAARFNRRIREDAEESVSEDRRLSENIIGVAGTPAGASEIRVAALAPVLDGLLTAGGLRTEQRLVAAEKRAAAHQLLGGMMIAAGYSAAILLACILAVRGDATPGDVLLVLTLAGGMAGNLRSVSTWTSELTGVVRFLQRYCSVVDLAGAHDRGGDTPVPPRVNDGIALEGISYSYPGGNSHALQDVTFHLPAGTVVAIVGDNGAGKSTLIKQLCRLYNPSWGRVCLDGEDLMRFDVREWRMNISAAFQDVARIEVTLRESVGVGDLAHADDEAWIRRALDRAGAADLEGVLPDGLEAQLGATWDGVELSTGQWQKVALARAMMRDDPLLLVLDEPTSSLDPEAEIALFERFASIAQDRRSRGGITLLVSHRFSTVQAAELIVVLSVGRLVGVGTHVELMQGCELYRNMYEVHARSYR